MFNCVHFHRSADTNMYIVHTCSRYQSSPVLDYGLLYNCDTLIYAMHILHMFIGKFYSISYIPTMFLELVFRTFFYIALHCIALHSMQCSTCSIILHRTIYECKKKFINSSIFFVFKNVQL